MEDNNKQKKKNDMLKALEDNLAAGDAGDCTCTGIAVHELDEGTATIAAEEIELYAIGDKITKRSHANSLSNRVKEYAAEPDPTELIHSRIRGAEGVGVKKEGDVLSIGRPVHAEEIFHLFKNEIGETSTVALVDNDPAHPENARIEVKTDCTELENHFKESDTVKPRFVPETASENCHIEMDVKSSGIRDMFDSREEAKSDVNIVNSAVAGSEDKLIMQIVPGEGLRRVIKDDLINGDHSILHKAKAGDTDQAIDFTDTSGEVGTGMDQIKFALNKGHLAKTLGDSDMVTTDSNVTIETVGSKIRLNTAGGSGSSGLNTAEGEGWADVDLDKANNKLTVSVKPTRTDIDEMLEAGTGVIFEDGEDIDDDDTARGKKIKINATGGGAVARVESEFLGLFESRNDLYAAAVRLAKNGFEFKKGQIIGWVRKGGSFDINTTVAWQIWDWASTSIPHPTAEQIKQEDSGNTPINWTVNEISADGTSINSVGKGTRKYPSWRPDNPEGKEASAYIGQIVWYRGTTSSASAYQTPGHYYSNGTTWIALKVNDAANLLKLINNAKSDVNASLDTDKLVFKHDKAKMGVFLKKDKTGTGSEDFIKAGAGIKVEREGEGEETVIRITNVASGGGGTINPDNLNSLINSNRIVTSKVEGSGVSLELDKGKVSELLVPPGGTGSLLEGSDTVTITRTPENNIKIDSSAKIPVKIFEDEPKPVTMIHVEDDTHTISSEGVLEINAIKAVDQDGTEISKLTTLKQGTGIKFAKSSTKGEVTITSEAARVYAQIGDGATAEPVDKIVVEHGLGSIHTQGSVKYLDLVGMSGKVGGDDTPKNIHTIKVVDNAVPGSTISDTGVLTINVPAAGGGGTEGDNHIYINGGSSDGSTLKKSVAQLDFDKDGFYVADSGTAENPKITLSSRGLEVSKKGEGDKQANQYGIAFEGGGVTVSEDDSSTATRKIAKVKVRTSVGGNRADGAVVNGSYDKITFDSDVFVLDTSTDNVINVKHKSPDESVFLGVFEGQAQLLAAAGRLKIPFKKYQISGLIRTEAPAAIPEGFKPTIGYTVWRWNMDKENPTPAEIATETNWQHDAVLAIRGSATPYVGPNSQSPSWTPASGIGYPASTSEGQIVYYTTDNLHYYSNGTVWAKLVPEAGSSSITVKGVDHRGEEIAEVTQATAKVQFGENMDTEIVTEAGESTYVKVSARGMTWTGQKEDGSDLAVKDVQAVNLTGVIMSQEGGADSKVINVRPRIPQNTTFLGTFDTRTELISVAKTIKILFLKHRISGMVQRKAEASERIIGYDLWHWASDTSKPTPTEIENDNNWGRTMLSALGQGLLHLGKNSIYPAWTPADSTTYPAANAPGQVIWYTNDGVNQGHYFSDGTKWTHINHVPMNVKGVTADKSEVEYTPTRFMEFDKTLVTTVESVGDIADRIKVGVRPVPFIGRIGTASSGTAVPDYTGVSLGDNLKMGIDTSVTGEKYVQLIAHDKLLVKASKAGEDYQHFADELVFDPETLEGTEETTTATGKRVFTIKAKVPAGEGVSIIGKDWNTSTDVAEAGIGKFEFKGGLNTEVVTETVDGATETRIRVSGPTVKLGSKDNEELVKINVTGNLGASTYDDTTGVLTLDLPTGGGAGGSPLAVTGHLATEATQPTVPEHTYTNVDKIHFKGGFLKNREDGSTHTLEWTSGIEAQAGTGDTPQTVSSIEVTGDNAYFSIGEENELNLAIWNTNEAATESELKTTHTPSARHKLFGYTKDSKTIYYCPSDKSEWLQVGQVGMPQKVKDLWRRYPNKLPDTSSTYSESVAKSLNYMFVKKDDVNNKLNLAGADQGYLHNIYGGEGQRWVQVFYEAVNNKVWVRNHGTGTGASANTWNSWEQMSGIDDACYTVMTIDNDVTAKDVSDRNYKMPYVLSQDPRANIIPTDSYGAFEVRRTGMYDINCIAQFTWEANKVPTETPTNTGAFMGIYEGTTEKWKIQTTENVYDSTKKEFHPLKGLFSGCLLQEGKTYHVVVALQHASGDEKALLELDPYKNMISIDPVGSRSKTGKRIMDNLYRSLGGISFGTGNEVRVERPTASGGQIRVFGEEYLTEFKTLTKDS